MSVTEENRKDSREEAMKYINLDKDKGGFTMQFIDKQIVTPCSVIVQRLTLQSCRKLQNDTILIHEASTMKYNEYGINESNQNIQEDTFLNGFQDKMPSGNIQKKIPPDNSQEDKIHKNVPSNNLQENVTSGNIQKDVPSNNIQKKDINLGNAHRNVTLDNVNDDIMSNFAIKTTQVSNARYQQSKQQKSRRKSKNVRRMIKCASNSASAIVTPCSVMLERLTLQSLRKLQNDRILKYVTSTVKFNELEVDVPNENIQNDVYADILKEDVPPDNIQDKPSDSFKEHILFGKPKALVSYEDPINDGVYDSNQDDVPLDNLQADVMSDNVQKYSPLDKPRKDVPSNKQKDGATPNKPTEEVSFENRQGHFQSDDLSVVQATNFQDDVLIDSSLEDIPHENPQKDVLSEKLQEDVSFDNPLKDISSDKPKKNVPNLRNSSVLTNDQNTIKTGQSVRKAKPYRPCLFCGKLQSKLKLHLKRRHAYEERVKRALLLPNNLQSREFNRMRKDGIYAANCKTLLDKNLKDSEKRAKLLIERRHGKKDISICSICNGFYATNTIYKHKYYCPGAAASTTEPTALPVSTIGDEKDPEDFRDRILAKFRRDKIGEICRRDAFIKLLGQQNFSKVKTRTEKKDELTDAIMRDMRRFATLFVEFKLVAEKKNTQIFSSIDILKREHFNHLKEAIVNLTTKEDGTIKSGLKVGLGFLIKKAAKLLKGHYLMQQKDAEAAEVENFSTVLSYFWISMFSDAEYANVKARQLDLRRPKHLPIEEDIQSLRNYTMTKIDELLNPYCLFTASEYTSLRDLIVCRLTLFNARRGGEPSRLLMQEWNDAENDEWINNASVQSINDPIEKQLIGKFKIAFQSGKNISQLVPVLIPNDCLKGIRKLADLEIRQNSGVHEKNIFLFPNTKHSQKHIKGWHAVRNVCIEAGLPKHITATSMRHRAATAYATLDVPEKEKQMFYRHMGHSEDMNINVYQCPMAVQEVTKVGKFLETLDTGEHNHAASPASVRIPVDSQNRSVYDDVHSSDDSSNGDNYHKSYSEDGDDSNSEDECVAEEMFYNSSSNKKDSYPASSKTSARMQIQSKKQCMAKDGITAGPSRAIKRKGRREIPQSVVEASSIESNSAGPSGAKSKRISTVFQGNINLSNDSHSSDDGSYSESDKDYSPDSEESSDMDSDDEYIDDEYIADEILHRASSRKKGQRISWSTEETRNICEYFSAWVDDTSSLDRKGSLPGKAVITEFLTKFPQILINCTMEKRVSLMRTKLYNERNKSRSKLTSYLSPMLK